MGYFICFVVPAIAIFLIICARPSAASRAHERQLRADERREFEALVARAQTMTGELDIDRALELLYEIEVSNAKELRRSRIYYLEQLARKGDLIAFQEWKHLTGNHDVVDIGRMPDITFTGVMVEW
jgi:hypothetical protein